MITMMRMKRVRTIDRKDTWWHTRAFEMFKAAHRTRHTAVQSSNLTFPSLSMFRCRDSGRVNTIVVSKITKWRSARMWSGPTAAQYAQQQHNTLLWPCRTFERISCAPNVLVHEFYLLPPTFGLSLRYLSFVLHTSRYPLEHFGQCVTSCDVVADHSWVEKQNH